MTPTPACPFPGCEQRGDGYHLQYGHVGQVLHTAETCPGRPCSEDCDHVEFLRTPRQMEDRRQGPRREAEVRLHYAEMLVLATAQAVADGRHVAPYLLHRLDDAVQQYRSAYLQTTDPETTPTPPPG